MRGFQDLWEEKVLFSSLSHTHRGSWKWRNDLFPEHRYLLKSFLTSSWNWSHSQEEGTSWKASKKQARCCKSTCWESLKYPILDTAPSRRKGIDGDVESTGSAPRYHGVRWVSHAWPVRKIASSPVGFPSASHKTNFKTATIVKLHGWSIPQPSPGSSLSKAIHGAGAVQIISLLLAPGNPGRLRAQAYESRWDH